MVLVLSPAMLESVCKYHGYIALDMTAKISAGREH